MDKSNIFLGSCNRSYLLKSTMYKVKRLVIMLGRLALPTCFSIESQGESEAPVPLGNKILAWAEVV